MKNFVPVMVLIAIQACVDPIPFEAEEEIPKLVIFGSFNQLYEAHEVTIKKTSKFGEPGIFVPHATVELMDEDGRTAEYYEFEGKYILPAGALVGEPGRAYKLRVQLSSGTTYESTWELMPEPVPISNTYHDIEFRTDLSESDVLIRQFFLDVYIDTPTKTENGDKAFFRWEVNESWNLSDFQCGPFDNADVCYYEVKNPFEKLRLYSGIDNSQENLSGYRLYSRLIAPYIQFSELHYFVVRQYSVSESTYDYWNKIDIVSNPTGSIFDKIPAGVQGNFNDVSGDTEVLGYFEVASVSTNLTLATREEISKSIQIRQECSPYVYFIFLPDYCCYCFLLPDQISKPSYWGDR